MDVRRMTRAARWCVVDANRRPTPVPRSSTSTSLVTCSDSRIFYFVFVIFVLSTLHVSTQGTSSSTSIGFIWRRPP